MQKDNPFDFKEAIIAHCRTLDKYDVYQWVADDEVKINNLLEENRQLKEQLEHCKDIECLLNEVEEQKEVIDKAISQLGMYADILTNNCDAYSICVSLLDTLKRGGINGRRKFQEKI